MGGPRSTGPPNVSVRPNTPQQVRPMRRVAPQNDSGNNHAMKRKRMDMLIPDTHDNDDCHVISMQKCNDGMPIIKNVQGANTPSGGAGGDSLVDPVVHLTDSITLSVRNPKDPAPVVQQKKNDAKAVANILATRGITVTPAAKTQKEASEQQSNNAGTKNGSSQQSPPPPVAINLNNAVSIIPNPSRGGPNTTQPQTNATSNARSRPQTVDLTEDEPVNQAVQKGSSTAATVSKRTLPHQCDLCPAQYPTLQSLMTHRRSYHKTGAPSELGVPVIDLRQPTVISKLQSIGIHNFIPLPQLGNGTGSFGLPIVSVNAAKNPSICNLSALGSGAVLPLGPLRHISNLPSSQK